MNKAFRKNKGKFDHCRYFKLMRRRIHPNIKCAEFLTMQDNSFIKDVLGDYKYKIFLAKNMERSE